MSVNEVLKKLKVPSTLERAFITEIRKHRLPVPVAELYFHPTRKWRFDFAYIDRMIAVECEGGTWSKGRHTTGQGFEDDCTKYNNAVLLGWRVFRFTGTMIKDGTAMEVIARALGVK